MRLHVTNVNHTRVGDSGGPWFWGNTAYGLHYGLVENTGGQVRAAFTPEFLLGYMNVRAWY